MSARPTPEQQAERRAAWIRAAVDTAPPFNAHQAALVQSLFGDHAEPATPDPDEKRRHEIQAGENRIHKIQRDARAEAGECRFCGTQARAHANHEHAFIPLSDEDLAEIQARAARKQRPILDELERLRALA